MLSRREFVKLVMQSTAALGIAELVVPSLAQAFHGQTKPPVIWLECMTCSGNVLSFLNTLNPSVRQLLMETLDWRFSNAIMAAEGRLALEVLDEIGEKNKGEFILIVEGTIPLRDKGRYCIIGHRKNGQEITALEAVRTLGSKAKYVMAVGTCATFGGPFASRPNPSQSVPVSRVLKGVQVVNVPGCPIHPDWAVGTLAHLLLYGIPTLDAYNRPTLFYGDLIHDNCPRRQHFENGIYAKHPGDGGCLYKIGCKGPVTYADCPTRQWISQHNNWPVEANTPCIGCTSPGFFDDMTPFFEHLPNVILPGITANSNKVGLAVAGLTLGGIGAHLTGKIITGRQHQKWVDNTISKEPENPAVYAIKEEPEAVTLAKLDELLEGQKKVEETVATLLKSSESNPLELSPSEPNPSLANGGKPCQVLGQKVADKEKKSRQRWFLSPFFRVVQAARKKLPLRRK